MLCKEAGVHGTQEAEVLKVNYYQASQVNVNDDPAKIGKWDYTRMNDGIVRAVGYCAEAGGGHHDTAEQANECYKKYLLDNCLFLNDQYTPDSQQKCCAKKEDGSVCSEWTQKIARVGYGTGRLFDICPLHMSRKYIEPLFEVGYEMSS